MERQKRLAILTTHPVQYHAPWFRLLAAKTENELEVFYCHAATPAEQAAAGFGVEFDWDIALLEGYRHRFLNNVAKKPAVSGFWGLDTPEIANIIKNGSYDAVLINGWHYKSAWQTMHACWNNATPVMVRSDSHLRNQRGLAKRVAKRPLYNWFIPRLDACLPVGTWSKEYFHHYGAKDERVFVVPHAIDDARIGHAAEALQPKRAELRQELGFSPGDVVFLFIGKFIERKCPLNFVQAIAQSANRNSSIAGLMVGDGPLRQRCEDYVRESNAPVRFSAFLNQSEIAKAYVAADTLVLPSTTETWGLVVNEAMTCGLPGFVSDQVGCGPDLIVPGQTGEVFCSTEVRHLIEKLVSYAAEPRVLAEMGRNARRKIADYSVENMVDSTLKAVSAVSNRC